MLRIDIDQKSRNMQEIRITRFLSVLRFNQKCQITQFNKRCIGWCFFSQIFGFLACELEMGR